MISVIFDMDGTLLDSQKIFIPAWDYAGELQGIKNVGNSIQYVCGMNEVGWSNYLVSNYNGLDLPKFKEDATKYIVKNGNLSFKDGAVELVSFLKERNIKIALASGSSRELIAYNLKAVNCPFEFDVIVGGEEVKNGKPAPDIFLLAAKRLGAKPCDCYVFEDSKNGIISAVNAGMKGLGVPDIVGFDDEVKSILTKEFRTLSEGIEFFKNLL